MAGNLIDLFNEVLNPKKSDYYGDNLLSDMIDIIEELKQQQKNDDEYVKLLDEYGEGWTTLLGVVKQSMLTDKRPTCKICKKINSKKIQKLEKIMVHRPDNKKDKFYKCHSCGHTFKGNDLINPIG